MRERERERKAFQTGVGFILGQKSKQNTKRSSRKNENVGDTRGDKKAMISKIVEQNTRPARNKQFGNLHKIRHIWKIRLILKGKIP